ncbi:MAG: pyridoxamine 5'-phosphate oxidase family protein [Bacteroidota bacterium]
MKYPVTALNQLKRGKKKESYDRETIHAILDSTEICHIAFIHEGKAMVQPINFGRTGDKLYVHGSNQNRMTTALIDAKQVSLNVTLLDAMKLTRSAFHHSVNYRSVIVFGSVRELKAHEEKLHGLKSIINHFVPNRWEFCRTPNEKELKATRVLEITIETASAKIADGPPNDNKEDLDLSYWAGTIPVKMICEQPIPDAHMDTNSVVPQHVMDFYDKRKR